MLAHLHHWFALIHLGGWTAAWIGFALIVFVSFIPVLPIPLIAGAVGAVVPPIPAIAVTWGAACLGAMIKYFIERLILNRPVNQWLRKYKYWNALVDYLQRNGFFAVLMTRLIPVFPSSVVNTAGALTGISIASFVWATLLGKLPTMVVFTVAGSQITTHFWRTFGWLSGYGLLVGGLTWWLAWVLRKGNRSNEGRDESRDDNRKGDDRSDDL